MDRLIGFDKMDYFDAEEAEYWNEEDYRWCVDLSRWKLADIEEGLAERYPEDKVLRYAVSLFIEHLLDKRGVYVYPPASQLIICRVKSGIRIVISSDALIPYCCYTVIPLK